MPKSLTVNNLNINNSAPVKKAETQAVPTSLTPEQVERRKSKFWDRFKNNLIEIFSEEEDTKMN